MAEQSQIGPSWSAAVDPRVVKALELLKVSVMPGRAQWTPTEVTLLVEGLAKVPAADRACLAGVVVVRDSDLGQDAGLSHHPDVAATDCSRTDLTGTVHIHLSDSAFTDTAPIWGQFPQLKTVVHEVGHVRIMAREVAAERTVLDAQAQFTAARRTAQAAVEALETVRTADTAVLSFAEDQFIECWNEQCTKVFGPADAARRVVFQSRFPRPDPPPGAWAATIRTFRDSLATARRSRDQAATALTTVKTALATLTSTVPARENDPMAVQCRTGISTSEAMLNALDHYLDAIQAMALERRHIEYFAWKMANLQADGKPAPFTAFTPYGRTAQVEWFAETYALAALNPARLRELSPAAADWYTAGMPGLPTTLDPLA